MKINLCIRSMLFLMIWATALKAFPAETRNPIGLCIGVDRDSAYVLGYQDLADAGVPIDKIDPRTLGLSNEGKPVPIYTFCADPAKFGPQDTLVFYGRYPRGKTTTVRPENDTNYYYLHWNQENPLRYSAAPPFSPQNPSEYRIVNCYWHVERTERNYLFEKFFHPDGELTDFYFWKKLDPTQDAPERSIVLYHHLFPNLPKEFPATFDLKMKFYGISQDSAVPQHHVQIIAGGKMIGEAKWDGVKEHVLDLKNVPAAALGASPGSTTLEIRFPQERIDQGVVDVVMLDWAEIAYWKATHSIKGMHSEFNTRRQPYAQYRYLVSGIQGGERDVILFNLTNHEIFLPGAIPNRERTGYNYMFFIRPEQPETDYVMLNQRIINPPKSIRAIYEEPAFTAKNQADMIIIYYPEFREEVEQLAQYRRSQGLKVLMVNSLTVFDQYSSGFLEDKAIREYLRFAWENYREPKPRYVLLVGDSTWDFLHIRYQKDRNLLPIHWQASAIWRWGGYPSENWYVAFDQEAKRPSMAIGRIPVNAKGQLTTILAKIKSYESSIGTGAWMDKAILVTSIEQGFRQLMEATARNNLTTYGLQCEILFPTAATATNDAKVLSERINEGCSLIYYYGHGGSFNWRVGPVDYSRQQDLFTADSVRGLANKARYPIVLATSCYTVSFDNYLSIGEVFLMEPDKGAVGVIATAWKSEAYVDHAFQTEMMQHMYGKKAKRLGDAFLQAKQSLYDSGNRQDMYETMILLGDPALKIHHPVRKP